MLNNLFLLPILLTGININIFAYIFFIFLFFYFVMSLTWLHFVVVFVILIATGRAAYKKGEKMFFIKLIIMSVANVFLNILALHLFVPYAMSIK